MMTIDVSLILYFLGEQNSRVNRAFFSLWAPWLFGMTGVWGLGLLVFLGFIFSGGPFVSPPWFSILPCLTWMGPDRTYLSTLPYLLKDIKHTKKPRKQIWKEILPRKKDKMVSDGWCYYSWVSPSPLPPPFLFLSVSSSCWYDKSQPLYISWRLFCFLLVFSCLF